MSDVVIRAENLGKKYKIQHQREPQRYTTLRDTITNRAKSLFRSSQFAIRNPQSTEDFWALRDVSFEVKEGEVVGIIGRNGAGKSTLLKILSRITEPTNGRVGIKGRVASLLEVGTGFHPELTGRENIYLNGAILGMAREEIKRKFDEIVAFAEIEKFLDTPVKRYSSGMYVRLAFAVAAHMEPEILIVDEVLAVGDGEFQKKCLGKMKSVASQEGRTVLFVSHNLIAVQRLCRKGLLLIAGKVTVDSDISSCIDHYITSDSAEDIRTGIVDLRNVPQRLGDGFRFLSISILDTDSNRVNYLSTTQVFHVELKFELERPYRDLFIGIGMYTSDDFPLYSSHSNDFRKSYSLEPGSYSVKVCVSPNYLRPGRYKLEIGAISSGNLISHIPGATQIIVEPVITNELANIDDRRGAMFIPLEWSEIARI